MNLTVIDWAIVAAYVVALTAAGTLAGAQPWARIQPFHFQLFVAGLVLMWAGIALRLWAVLVLGRSCGQSWTLQEGA